MFERFQDSQELKTMLFEFFANIDFLLQVIVKAFPIWFLYPVLLSYLLEPIRCHLVACGVHDVS